MSAPEFMDKFRPRKGVNYQWVVAYANARYAETVEAFRMLEQRATVVIGYMTAGAGVLTVGALAGLIRGDVTTPIIISAIPAALAGIAAVILVGLSIRPTRIPRPYSIPRAVMYAEYFGDGEHAAEGAAEAAFAATINWAVEEFAPIVEAKGKLVVRAVWASMTAVTLLLIPLGVAIYMRM